MQNTHSRTTSSPVTLLMLAIVYVVWGSTFLAISVAVDAMPPLMMMGVRFSIAGVILVAISRRTSTRAQRATDSWRRASITAALMLVVGMGATAVGEQSVPSGMAALLASTVAIWIVLMTAFVQRRAISVRECIGMASGIVGVGLLVAPSLLHGGGVNPVGVASLALASIAWAAGTLHMTWRPASTSPMRANAMQMLVGGVMLTAFGAISGERMSSTMFTLSAQQIGAFVWLVVAGSLGAYTAHAWLVANTTPAVASTYAYVNPVVALALGASVAGEPITGLTLVAGAFVIAAVVALAGADGAPEPARVAAAGEAAPGDARTPARAASADPGRRRRRTSYPRYGRMVALPRRREHEEPPTHIRHRPRLERNDNRWFYR